MLLYVLESRGSSPGRQGFFMAVNANSEMEGSVGGGIMEHKFVELAKERLKTGNTENSIRKQVHDKSVGAEQSGMICSGQQTIFLYRVTTADALGIANLISSLNENRNGTLELSPGGLSFTRTVPPEDYAYTFHAENDWVYREKTGYKQQLFIIGGGHCALALSRLMRSMDFYITLYEEREGLNTVERNRYAQEIIQVDDYTGLGNLIPSGKNQYVVIMTFGYRTDDVALRALRNKSFTYLGVLGSRSKMEKLLTTYQEEGVDPAWLQGINSPIGLAINSQRPEEIAISIAAEIISIKNKPGPDD